MSAYEPAAYTAYNNWKVKQAILFGVQFRSECMNIKIQLHIIIKIIVGVEQNGIRIFAVLTFFAK